MLEYAQRLLSLARPYQGRLALGVVAGILAGLIEPLVMVAVKLALDALFPSGHSAATPLLPEWLPGFLHDWAAGLVRTAGELSRETTIVLAVASIPVVMGLRGTLGYLNVYSLQWVAVRAITDLRARLFAHLIALPLAFFNRRSTGELMSRVNNDTAVMQASISDQVPVVIRDPVTLVSLLVFVIYTQPSWSLVTLLTFPLCIIPIAIYGRKVRQASRAIQERYGRLTQMVHEAFTGARVVKAYNLEERVVRRYAQTSREFVSHFMRVIRSVEVPGPLIEFMAALGVALFFIYIGTARTRPATTNELIQFIGCVFLMYKPVKSLTRVFSKVQQARAASDRVWELLEERSDLPEPAHPRPLPAAGGDIEFDRVEFSYGEKRVLHGVTLRVRAGQFVALVGASGSGKTTLTNLLLRFYDPQAGAIRIGGVDIRQVATRDLRRAIAVVTQETILFNDTIRENIRLGRPEATDAEIEAAARHAHAWEFIAARPEGFETVIGEKGVLLSGGQRQRLAIARAILKDAPILVLDEATSSLDTESERAVQAALDELTKDRTTICIAHRLSTIQAADLIVVLDQGRVVEQGTHAELLARNGVYRRLHDLQFNV
ncbi:MAG: ABC transporter ATP-binding protein [Verrucomicrobia bacterium]|nr:ABC transporter ATP-binding protein [Verrucomicrobiota bacterium]